jgi:hypothetical protein
MKTRTETDMRSFESALDECTCHLFANEGTGRISGCGRVRREEQPWHGRVEDWAAPVCPTCGLQKCAECLKAFGA